MTRSAVLSALGFVLALGSLPALAQEPPSEPVRPPNPGLAAEQTDLTIGGKDAQAARPDAEIGMAVTIFNHSSTEYRDVVATIEPSTAGIKVLSGKASLGTIPAGESQAAGFRFSFPASACEEFLGFMIRFDSSPQADPTNVGVPAECPGPRLSIDQTEYVGGDGDAVPEPGETLKVFVTLRNDGRDPARDVKATLATTTDGVRVIDPSASWATIGAGSSARGTALEISIGKDVTRAPGCGGMPGSVRVPGAGGGTAGGGGEATAAGSADTPVAVEGSVEPDASGAGTPRPTTAAEDPAAAMDLQLRVTATGYHTELDIGTQIVCALASGVDGLGAGAPREQADQGAGSKSGAKAAGSKSGARRAAVPVAIAVLVVAAAVLVRFRFSRSR